jgi:ribokinase
MDFASRILSCGDAAFCEVLRQSFQAEGNFIVCGEATNSVEAIKGTRPAGTGLVRGFFDRSYNILPIAVRYSQPRQEEQMGNPIIVVGSINLDLVAGAPRIPRPGETLTGNSFRTFFGGKGANQAVAAARLGHPAMMVGSVGDDAFGEQLKSGLQQAGVSIEAVNTVPGASGVAIIVASTAGQNSIVVIPGANGQLGPQQLERHSRLLQKAGILLAQLEIPLESVELLAELAERYDIPFMLDPAPARGLSDPLLRKVTWLTPNETEAESLLNIDELAAGDVVEAVSALLQKGPKNVILKLGTRGCVLATAGKAPEIIPAFSVQPVDTTAAGDAFSGGFAVGLMRGYASRDSAIFASAVAAISVTRHGAQSSMPTDREVLSFLKERKSDAAFRESSAD